MTYTIQSATWGNAEHTAAVIITAESGAVAISQIDRPQEWSAFTQWAASNPVSPAPRPSAIQQRETAFLADATRADLLARLRKATLAEIDTFVDNNITGSTLAVLRTEIRTLFKQLLKILALNVQR